ncbi:family 43 glycosylhydrolase [Amycolatopsis sp. NPDC051128]|uniref:family 43 glycosylhydrolase n=1 Tax=Amycolatopsis sp. NPDC051128 TaxID=3155412 RepID=UPI0034280CEF
MGTRHRLWAVLAPLTAAVLVGGGLAATPPAQAAAGCSVTYTKTSEWQGGFGASVSITNLGDPIAGWTLEWSFAAGQQVREHWNATITQSGTQVSAKNVAHNSAIPTGGAAEFGFNGSFSSANPVPESFRLNGTTCTGGVTPTTPVTTPTTSTPTTTTTPNQPATFTNPVLWQDFADVDIIRVGDAYYYSASTMHYSPGAPILRSYDLVNWEFAGHSVPKLDFGAKYDLNGGRGYVRGIWASFLNHRASNDTYYWGGCVDFAKTHIYTATAVDGQWTKHATIDKCYYDAGMLVDDNDTMYVAYGNTSISVAQLSADGKSEVRSQQVFQTPSNIGTLEGSRFYKRNGSYYIFLTRPANGQYILKASNPFGPYTLQQVLLDLPGPIQGGGVPHQGGLVQTQNGDWYYMSFVDAYPGGRVPALAPVTWTADGWPRLQTVNGRWGVTYPKPNLPPPPRQVEPMTGTDTFQGTTLRPHWEWNHNPDTTKFSVGNGLKLSTATVTNDLYAARNTLTRRIQGPTSTATATLDLTAMRDGDRTGLAMLRDSSAWIGVKRDGGRNRVVMVNGLTMDSNWNTTGTGTETASAALSGTKIWLRANADIRPGTGRQARFSYSTDGVNFTPLGAPFTLNNAWQFFMGYRFAVFNHATQALGGAVTLQQFDLTTP